MMKLLKCMVIHFVWIVHTTALPPCSFKRGVGITLTCDVSQQNVTSLQWKVGGRMSEVYPNLTTCNLQGCDQQSYLETHTFVASVQLDPTSTHIVSSSLKLPGDHFFSFYIDNYICVPYGGHAIRICDDLKYFDDPTPPFCWSPTVADNEVKIKCTIAKVYPTPECRVNITSEGHNRNIATNTIVEHSVMVPNPDYMSYSANCTVSIPLSELGVGDYVFQLVASADFNYSELAIVYSNKIPLTVFDFLLKPECMYPVINMTTEAIMVECSTSYVYPAFGCQLETFKNNIALEVTANVTCSNGLEVYNGRFLLVSKCIHSVPLYHIGPGSFKFKATVYKVINGTEINGTRVTGDFNVPFVLKNPTVRNLSHYCPDKVRTIPFRKWATCECILDEVGIPRGNIEWHTSDGTVYNSVNITAYIDDFRANRTFTCQAKTPIADNLPGYTWTPIWPDPPVVKNFTANGQDVQLEVDVNTSVTLDCKPEGTPLPKAVITKVGSNVALSTNDTSAVVKISECTDTSDYMCQVMNSSGSAVDSSLLNIMVKCPVQLLNKTILPITQSKSGADVELHLLFSGYPQPSTFLLAKNTVKGPESLMAASDFYVKSQWTDTNIINVGLTVKNVRETASYKLTLGNGIGHLLDVNFSISTEAETSHVNVGAIVGGVIGGILAIVVVVLIYFILLRRRNRQ